MKFNWKEKPGGTKESHWIDLIAQVDTVTLANGDERPCWWYEAGVKFDGCIHFKRAYNEPFDVTSDGTNRKEDMDYFHICDIDELILLLVRLHSEAIKHFGEDWDK